MAQRQPFSSFFQDSLKLISYCPLCQSHYNPMEAKMIEQRDEANLIHVQCQKCQSSIIVLVASHPSGSASVGMLTDLTAEDLMRFRSSDRVSCDDLLNLHQLFQEPGPVSVDQLF